MLPLQQESFYPYYPLHLILLIMISLDYDIKKFNNKYYIFILNCLCNCVNGGGCLKKLSVQGHKNK